MIRACKCRRSESRWATEIATGVSPGSLRALKVHTKVTSVLEMVQLLQESVNAGSGSSRGVWWHLNDPLYGAVDSHTGDCRFVKKYGRRRKCGKTSRDSEGKML